MSYYILAVSHLYIGHSLGKLLWQFDAGLGIISKPITYSAGGQQYVSVLVGLCTHLGCAPEMAAEIRPEPDDAQWKGGYFCPCHKSRFDMAGRVFQDVPAPTNLVVPPHHYVDDNTIVIGVDPQGGA